MYVLIFREDAEPSLKIFSDKNEVLKFIEEFNIKLHTFENVFRQDLKDLDFDKIPAYTSYLFKGVIVIPKEKKVVTEITID